MHAAFAPGCAWPDMCSLAPVFLLVPSRRLLFPSHVTAHTWWCLSRHLISCKVPSWAQPGKKSVFPIAFSDKSPWIVLVSTVCSHTSLHLPDLLRLCWQLHTLLRAPAPPNLLIPAEKQNRMHRPLEVDQGPLVSGYSPGSCTSGPSSLLQLWGESKAR